MPSLYIETSIISHAAARPLKDPVVRALQIQARRWWDEERLQFDLFTSQAVIDEASLGDEVAAAERLELIKGVPLVDINDEVVHIAGVILSHSLMPPKAGVDALHVAASAVAGVDYLLTQNCRHIANAHTLPQVYDLLNKLGVSQPLICTPAEFLEDPEDDSQSNS